MNRRALLCVCLGAGLTMGASRPATNPAEDTRSRECGKALQKAKVCRLVVRQRYEQAPKVSLPFREACSKLLGHAGVRVVEGAATAVDYVIHMDVVGIPDSREYRLPGKMRDRGTTLWTGAYLKVTMSVLRGKTVVWKQKLSCGESAPGVYVMGTTTRPSETSKDVPYTPDKAPFDGTFHAYFLPAFSGKVAELFGLEPLEAALADPDRHVRKGAAEALRVVGGPAVPHLVRAYSGSNRSAAVAAWTTLRGIRNKNAVEPLAKALEHTNINVCNAAAVALGAIRDPRAAGPLIQASRRTQEAERSLVKLGAPAVEPLIAALRASAEDKRHRSRIILVLGSIGDSRAEAVTISCLSDPDRNVRRAAAMVLGRFKPQTGKAAEALLSLIATEKDREIRKKALASLGGGNLGAAAVPALLEALKDKDWLIRYDVVAALGKVKDPRSVNALIAALDDESRFVRVGAVRALGAIGDPRATRALVARLKDPRGRDGVNGEVAAVLSRLKSPDYNALMTVYRDENRNVREVVIHALGNSKDPRALTTLVEALQEPDLRGKAGAALGRLAVPGTVDALIAALKDKDPRVRQAAISALAGQKDKRAIEPMIEMLKDADRNVRYAAKNVLKSMTGKRGKMSYSQWRAWALRR